MGRARIHASDADRRAAQDYRRKETRKAHNLNFIMVDGEGIGDGKEHRYVLLGVGNSQIENPDGLSFAQIMEHLYSSFLLSPDSVFSGYYLGYDFAQWLRKLPRERAGMLLSDSGIAKRVRRRSGPNKTPFPVRYQGWEFDLLAMKRFKLRPELGGKWMYICDAGSFFQTSFLGAIDPAKWSEPIVTESEFALLSEGKARRSVAALDDEMRYYNRLENEVGSRLLRATNQGFTHAGIRLKRDQWFGPGQAAQEWVRKTECPKAEDLKHRREMLDVARRTYYGGWFEICAHGICPGTSYEYDINSAYPAIIARLPCLLHGDWREGIHNGYTICHAIVRGSDKYLGAMLHRLADGNIRRPNETRGWYWQSEIDAAIRAGLIDTVDVEEAYTYVPCDCRPPLRGIAGMYDERLRVGKNSTLGKDYKLIYNSAYGKFAQSVGNPVFGNAFYASMITSGCRTMILDAIATHPLRSEAVLMIATDGIYFSEPHPSLPISDKLGEWDAKEHENLTLFKPGVYWDDKARQRIAEGKNPNFRARGINAQEFAKEIARIDNHYREWGDSFPAERDPMGSRQGWHPLVAFSTSFSMVSPAQALQWGRWETCGTLGHSEKHASGCLGCNGAHLIQDSDPIAKRHSGHFDSNRRIYKSHPHRDGGYVFDSCEYDKRFGQPDSDELGWNPEGTVLDSFARLLRE